MSRWRNNGGWNKTHGTVEKTPRIDSFEAGDGWGTLFGYADGGIPLVLDCFHNTGYALDGKWENLEVWNSKAGWTQTIELSRKRNGFGGSQPFFLCPACGERVRYLYLTGGVFLCRKCSRLNYRSQQETRSDSMYSLRPHNCKLFPCLSSIPLHLFYHISTHIACLSSGLRLRSRP